VNLKTARGISPLAAARRGCKEGQSEVERLAIEDLLVEAGAK
jgi:hypothetical protein